MFFLFFENKFYPNSKGHNCSANHIERLKLVQYIIKLMIFIEINVQMINYCCFTLILEMVRIGAKRRKVPNSDQKIHHVRFDRNFLDFLLTGTTFSSKRLLLSNLVVKGCALGKVVRIGHLTNWCPNSDHLLKT